MIRFTAKDIPYILEIMNWIYDSYKDPLPRLPGLKVFPPSLLLSMSHSRLLEHIRWYLEDMNLSVSFKEV